MTGQLPWAGSRIVTERPGTSKKEGPLAAAPVPNPPVGS
jgi:hypothetical protein